MVERGGYLDQPLQECFLRLLGFQPKTFPGLMRCKELTRAEPWFWRRCLDSQSKAHRANYPCDAL
jgi:hypothetical protein